MKVDYGVRALVDLAQYGEGRPVRTSEIAARNKFGLIRSRRGPNGGHVLAKNAADISLSKIMITLEGRTAALDCIDEPAECVLSAGCAQREIWRGVDEAIQQVLETTSVASLAERQRSLAAQLA